MRSTVNSWLQEFIGRDEAWYRERTDYLAAFVTDRRAALFRSRVAERTRYITLCTEDTFHTQNASALVRHCDAFGIQDLHTIEGLCPFRPNVHIARGTEQWVDVHHHASTAEALGALRQAGYRILATSPHRGDTQPETIDLAGGRLALVFGTEHAGISAEVEAAADLFVRIPMYGFVESLNLSASAAILLHTLSRRLRAEVPAWRLTPQEQAETLFLWMARSVGDSAPEVLRRRYPEMFLP